MNRRPGYKISFQQRQNDPVPLLKAGINTKPFFSWEDGNRCVVTESRL
jgi:hypothetical protein